MKVVSAVPGLITADVTEGWLKEVSDSLLVDVEFKFATENGDINKKICQENSYY